VGWSAFRRLGLTFDSAILNGLVAAALFGLAIVFVIEAIRAVRRAAALRAVNIAPSTA
jgi:hypothetical protein